MEKTKELFYKAKIYFDDYNDCKDANKRIEILNQFAQHFILREALRQPEVKKSVCEHEWQEHYAGITHYERCIKCKKLK